jgi:UDP-N-acetylmuramoylalanine--D-glutamate ligase
LLAEVRRVVDRLYLIGEDGPAIGEALEGTAPAENCQTLDEAVARARKFAASGHMVLLAPACASFDQFSDYGERGDCFSDLAREEVASCP